MKKVLLSLITLTLFVATPAFAQDYCASSKCEWSDSYSAQEFVDSLTDPMDGVLFENWPVYAWSVEISDQRKFDRLMDSVVYFKRFVANRVLELCEYNREAWGETDMSTCEAARTYIRNTWMDKLTGEYMDEELTESFNDVDPENWFSFESFNAISEEYVQTGVKRLYVVRDFWHAERLVDGGCTMTDLPIVVDLQERTISIISSQLFD